MTDSEGFKSDDDDRARTNKQSSKINSLSGVHPFFMPLSAKRANAVPANGDKIFGTLDTDKPLKRQRKKTDESKQKSTKIQSFFAVTTNKPSGSAAALRSNAKDAKVEATRNAAHVGAGEALGAQEIPFEYDSESKATIQQQPRRILFRSPGIPAPYPHTDSHVPRPVYTRFSSTDHLAGCESHRLISAAAIDLAGSQLTDRQAQRLCSYGKEQLNGLYNQHISRGSANAGTLNPNLLKAIVLPIYISFGEYIPAPPQHLKFLEPVLDTIRNNAFYSDAQKSQLLSARYRPKRISHVLGNQKAVHRLRLWIENMRLKRLAPPAACDISSDEFVGSALADTSSKKHSTLKAGKGGGRHRQLVRREVSENRRSTRQPDNTRITDNESDEDYKYFLSNCDSESSDDFMPTNISRRAQSRKNNEMRGIMAWAKSNGTLNSVRENTQGVLRHRRNGSGGMSGSDSESFSNIILLAGPSGSCKTASVYACAEECGFEVQEIHPGQRRSGKDLLAVLEDAILTHTISTSSSGTRSVGDASLSQMLVLIDHVDILFEQDQRLWPALKQLALKSKRPIVLTCTDASSIRWDEGCFHSVLQFQRPGEHALVPYSFFLCLAEGALILPKYLVEMCQAAKCDINQMLSSLEIAIRQANMWTFAQRASSNISVPTGSAVSQKQPTFRQAELKGMISWLFGNLNEHETPELRYRFWIDLISSTQAANEQGSLFEKWPDPPPPSSPSAQGPVNDSNTIIAANQNRFFAISASSIAVQAGAAPCFAQLNDTQNAIVRTAIPIVISDIEQLCISSGCSDSQLSSLSELEDIERTAFMLDTLSFARTTTSATEIHTECFYEPLYSHQTPMLDGCLDVSYITLDADVLSRRNPALLADDIGIYRHGSAPIDDYLRHAATRSFKCLAGSRPLIDKLAFCMKPQSRGEPRSLPALPEYSSSCQSETEQRIQNVLEVIGLTNRHRVSPLLAMETVSFLAQMVFWDHVHLGKAEQPTAINLIQMYDGDEHMYRIGTRRTRMNTYRIHIKQVPELLQTFLVSWTKFEQ
ncbi:hypothetical protein BX070DRAFT_245020 [Coemansia spiralis]|nr:hypothetical protein BX070DRAFT_245020 [Coemansia spiralis]